MGQKECVCSNGRGRLVTGRTTLSAILAARQLRLRLLSRSASPWCETTGRTHLEARIGRVSGEGSDQSVASPFFGIRSDTSPAASRIRLRS